MVPCPSSCLLFMLLTPHSFPIPLSCTRSTFSIRVRHGSTLTCMLQLSAWTWGIKYTTSMEIQWDIKVNGSRKEGTLTDWYDSINPGNWRRYSLTCKYLLSRICGCVKTLELLSWMDGISHDTNQLIITPNDGGNRQVKFTHTWWWAYLRCTDSITRSQRAPWPWCSTISNRWNYPSQFGIGIVRRDIERKHSLIECRA